MFLFKRKHRKKRRKSNFIYYLFSILMICSGVVAGYSNVGQDVVHDTIVTLNSASVIKFSFIKSLVIITFIYLNSFSLVGIPVCSSVLILNGYMLISALNSMYSSAQNSKFIFILTNLPYLTMHIFALILISSAALDFSKNLFVYVIKSANKLTINNEFKELTFKYIISIILVFLSAMYEGYVL